VRDDDPSLRLGSLSDDHSEPIHARTDFSKEHEPGLVTDGSRNSPVDRLVHRYHPHVQAEARAAGYTPERRIIVVEGLAHFDHGHYPIVFARLAEAFLELGYDVDVQTSRGWSAEGDAGFRPLRIHRYGKIAVSAERFAARLHRVRPRALGAQLVKTGKTAVLMSAARWLRRRTGATDVIVLTWSDPLAVGIAAGGGRWLCYTGEHGDDYGGVSEEPRFARLDQLLARCSRWAEAWRRRHGGRMRIATTTEASRRGWEARAVWGEPVAIPLATAFSSQPVADARERLDLPAHERLALHFGNVHPGKDSETVWRAFEGIHGWRLVVAGLGGADPYRRWAGQREGDIEKPPILVDGFLDEETKGLVYSAVDLAVLSFQPGRHEDSAALTDAIAWGLPVVCSDDCAAAETVRRHGLGTLFPPGDIDALAAAIDRAPEAPNADGLARARDELSPRAIALRCLDALAPETPSISERC